MRPKVHRSEASAVDMLFHSVSLMNMSEIADVTRSVENHALRRIQDEERAVQSAPSSASVPSSGHGIPDEQLKLLFTSMEAVVLTSQPVRVMCEEEPSELNGFVAARHLRRLTALSEAMKDADHYATLLENLSVACAFPPKEAANAKAIVEFYRWYTGYHAALCARVALFDSTYGQQIEEHAAEINALHEQWAVLDRDRKIDA